MMLRVYQPVPSLASSSEWTNDYQDWRDTPHGNDQWVYIRAYGIYSGLRSKKEKLCALVIIGVNGKGQKQFLAIEDGMRESIQSWREVLLKLKSRGMNIPQLAIGDGWSPGILGCHRWNLPTDTSSALLGAQNSQYS